MMKREWDLLFFEYDLRSVLDAQLASVDDRVLQIPQRRFEAESDDRSLSMKVRQSASEFSVASAAARA